MDHEEFRQAGYKIIDEIVEYYKTTSELKPTTDVQPGYLPPLLPKSAPEDPENFDQIHKDFKDLVVPGLTHWQSSNFFGYFPCTSSYPSMLAEMYSNMFNSQGFDWICNPAASELEGVVMNWLGQLLGLDDSFLSDKSETKGCGSIQATASEGTLVSMIAARNKVLKKLTDIPSFNDNEEFRDTKKLVVYTSNQSHSSFVKAAKILNIKIHTLKTDENGSVQPQYLKDQIAQDLDQGLIPFYVGLCLGTTGVGAVDNILDCLPVAQEHDLWVHVDAAWAGAYLMLPKYQVYNGFKGIDSIVFNPHKLLLTNFDCCALWTKNRFDLIEALSADASYYTNFATQSGKVIDYKNLQVPLGRRFRSLKLWFVLRNYGAKGLRGLLQNNLDLAQYLVDLISNDSIFEITHPTTFSLVCFRMKPQTESESPDLTNRRNKWIYETISKEGNFLIGHSNFNSKYIFRISIGNQHNTQESVTQVYEKLKSLAMEVDQHVE